mmetsp:Transcript_20432/g.43822  ORF Transcript_20432/g.43822 Transcript_20432/m.43822 type:complete len:180 (+) Transcript_20432:175-714(+)|eukprot:CAMPEP_0172543460 /NCGR_PEP_ID=MMETSP1067-20121228/13854_1 /TAXON_ID=265564 ORGANISM="Thalassiosira punctigera, Strain Tpunct2005C2" /NCGR_SAMPLE_ID=MMETSP1067 /ASSEMBLY_ACC=CAM_ASM_000444 /LENGTH=179 /DNA_ID=CAMNT_0013329885 /DNA_START=106 /DNA_END=645 /DNA_ORIENTATION=-
MASFSLHRLFILLLAISFLLLDTAQAQFGIKKGVPISLPDQNGELYGGASDVSQQKEGFLSEQDAIDMEAIITEAKKDIETMAMVTKMKEENMEGLAKLKKLSTMEVLGGMKETLDNLKLIEYLFKDKEKAVLEMEKEGMIDKAHIKKYRKDPDLLEKDTRRGLYFQFVSLAVVGGFIE